MKKKVIIGLTYGDPAGIGPEILLKTLNGWKFKLKPIVVGLKKYLFGSNKYSKKVHYKCIFEKKNNINKKLVRPGVPSEFTGRHSYECLQQVVKLVNDKYLNAIVTGPVSKFVINDVGIKFSGQTEKIAELSGKKADDVIMLFVARDLRISLFTRHIPLNQVSKEITCKKLFKHIVLLNNELKKWFCIKNPRILVLGVNPHASENSMFGHEEIKIIKPVVEKLKSNGYKLYGPSSADASLASAGKNFLLGKNQQFDAYVSFYHDQSLPFFKAVAGMEGVNVTLGLPFLRVSVDHGTAYDIAGKNKASNKSLISAIKLLEELLC